MAERQLDRASLPLSEFVENAADIEGAIYEDVDASAIQIERAELGLPIELDVLVDEHGEVVLGATPPLYYLETSVMPVFHHLTLTLEPMEPPGDG